MQYSYDSILIRALLTKFRSAYWSRVILGWVFRDVTYFMGGPLFVTKCDGEGGSKLVKNSVTYFRDGPIATSRQQI